MADAAPEITVEELRGVATTLLSEVATHAQSMLDYLLQRIPEAGADEEITGLTLGSCSSNLEAALSMVRHGIPVSATEAPVTALEHARAMAARGHSVDVMLRFYRLGHAWFAERVTARIGEWIEDERVALRAVGELDRFSFVYVDRISSQVAAEYVAELERRQNRARAVRTDVVRSLLEGKPIDLERAERALSHRLTATQIAFICWADRGEEDLQRVGAAVAAELGAQRPLLISDGARALWGWVASASVPAMSMTADARRLAATVAGSGESVHVAVGEPHPGAAGFRASHLEALRARRVVELSRRRPPTATRFAEVALVDALSQDVEAARALVRRELRALGLDGRREHDERAALLAVLDAQGGVAAAAERLGLHRNTVLGRIRRAEERRGRPAVDGLLELHAALRLAEILGPVVLTQP